MQDSFGAKELVILAVSIMLLLFLTLLFGLIGLRFSLGLLLYFIPLYFIMDNFNLSYSEKVVFAFFISLGIYPSLVYWLGVIIPFKIAVFLSFALLLVIGILIRKLKQRNSTSL